MANKRLIATLAYKASGAVAKVLYLGHNADEAKAAMTTATDKGYFEIRVCRDIDYFFLFRHRAEPANLVKT